MTVAQLIEALKQFDPELPVVTGEGQGWARDLTTTPRKVVLRMTKIVAGISSKETIDAIYI